MNNTTRRHPRTLEEAFGPHTSKKIYECDDTGYTPTWWAVVMTIAIVALFVIISQG